MAAYHSTQAQRQHYQASMADLNRQLAKLAPHPDHRDEKGPVLVKIAKTQIPDERDGMLGGMLLEQLVAPGFAAVADQLAPGLSQSMSGIQVDQLVEVYDEWARTRESDRQANGGDFLSQRKVISGAFNSAGSCKSERDVMMKAFLADLPERMRIEQGMAKAARELDRLDKMDKDMEMAGWMPIQQNNLPRYEIAA